MVHALKAIPRSGPGYTILHEKNVFIHSFAKTFKDARSRHEDDEYADSYDCAEEPVLVGAGEGRRGVVAELDGVAVVVREAHI